LTSPMIWIGLGLITLGTLIFVLVGLIWPAGDTPLHKGGFLFGTTLIAIGTLLTIMAG